MGDLYSRWVGARELLLHHRNPYGPEVTAQIQTAFYGHPVNQHTEHGTHLFDEQRFAYPVYTVLMLAPAVYADFSLVRQLARVFLAVLTAGSIMLCFSLLHQQLRWQTVTALSLFTLSSPQIVQGLRLEQLALLVGFLLLASVWCTAKHRLPAGGFFLALATIKPQMMLLPASAFLIWAFGDWSKRWPLVASFLTTLASLLILGEFLLPGWIGYFAAGISAYRRYAPASSILQFILGHTLGTLAGLVLVIALVFMAWQNRTVAAGSRGFINTFAWVLLGTVIAFPLFAPFNQALLILPTMLLLADLKSLPRVSKVLLAAAVGWPWVADVVLLLFRLNLDSSNQLLPRLSFLVSFFPLVLLLVTMTRTRKSALQAEAAEW